MSFSLSHEESRASISLGKALELGENSSRFIPPRTSAKPLATNLREACAAQIHFTSKASAEADARTYLQLWRILGVEVAAFAEAMPLAKIDRMMLMGGWIAVTTASKNSSTSTAAASG